MGVDFDSLLYVSQLILHVHMLQKLMVDIVPF